MTGTQQNLFYTAIMLAVGLGIPILAALNGGLATRLLGLALMTAGIFLAVRQ